MFIQVHALAHRAETDLWMQVEDATSGRLRIQTQWFTMSTDPADLEERKAEVHGLKLSTAVLLVYIDSCKQLPLTKPSLSKPDPVVQVRPQTQQNLTPRSY